MRALRSYLEHRVAQHVDPRDRIQACLDGILAQAEDVEASSKTRPFIEHKARLNRERNRLHTMSSDVVDLLGREIRAARVALGMSSDDVDSDARWLHALIMAVMEEHIIAGTAPTAEEKDSLFAFCFRALGDVAMTIAGAEQVTYEALDAGRIDFRNRHPAVSACRLRPMPFSSPAREA